MVRLLGVRTLSFGPEESPREITAAGGDAAPPVGSSGRCAESRGSDWREAREGAWARSGDWDERGARKAMSGSASLGLRSGSYGSLASGGGRKAGARGWGWRGEKERLPLLHHALRLVGRRRAGMLLLAVASAAVFCSLLAVVKGSVHHGFDALKWSEVRKISNGSIQLS